jgi:phosphoglycerol transferase MdoB-like AlkP superfamily enzyme
MIDSAIPTAVARRPSVVRRRAHDLGLLVALARRAGAVLTVGRLRAIWILLGLFLALNLLVRLGLAVFNGDPSLWWPWRLLPALAIGALFDAAAGVLGLAPLALLLGLWPQRGSEPTPRLRRLVAALLLPLCVLLVFVAFAEFTFWNEFSSRFNFIAVDYLIFTREVVGNIRESYNLPLLLAAVALLALLLWALAWRRLRRVWSAPPAGWKARGTALAVWVLLLPAVALWAVDARYKEFSRNAQLNELAGNGYFDFWHAFRTNEIDYERYYRVLPHAQAVATLAKEISGHRPGDLQQHPNERRVAGAGPQRRLNVVLVSVESLSAEFLGSFGNTQGLTPNLDRLAQDGLLFTKLYATGTRTVRGLEALTLSVPPTPGLAIVKRPDNADLFTIGAVFESKGYEALYLYGGYGYFDNMNAFFAGNGYTVVDRTALSSTDIHFENIWGVADEDLFTLTLRELDARQARGTPFFAHVMTTSNHRPFTYPGGRIDIPPKTGRDGGVKYTDYAIGRFIDEARTRPWFASTVFVIVADHTHNGRGRQELPPDAYHIPMIIYAPGLVQPGRIDSIASQIDVAPTLLALLNMSYDSRFFGQDILREGRTHQRAFLSNYQTVGYYERGRVVELRPNGRVHVVVAADGKPAPDDALSRELQEEAISYYQLASRAYRSGAMKLHH